MITINFAASELSIKSDWSEITVRDFIALENIQQTGDIIDLLSILSSKPRKEIKAFYITDDDEIRIAETIDWVNSFNENYLIKKDHLTIDGKVINIPTDLSVHTFAQKVAFEQAIKPHLIIEDGFITGFKNSAIPLAIAIYLQPLITGKSFDADSINTTAEKINDLLFIEAAPIASFFLNRYKALLRKRERLYTRKTMTLQGQGSNPSHSLAT